MLNTLRFSYGGRILVKKGPHARGKVLSLGSSARLVPEGPSESAIMLGDSFGASTVGRSSVSRREGCLHVHHYALRLLVGALVNFRLRELRVKGAVLGIAETAPRALREPNAQLILSSLIVEDSRVLESFRR